MVILIADVVKNGEVVETKEFNDFPFVPAIGVVFRVRNTDMRIDNVQIDPTGLAGTPIVTITGREV